jgi:SOCE-associated regulatory factor of calcium homoeostasis
MVPSRLASPCVGTRCLSVLAVLLALCGGARAVPAQAPGAAAADRALTAAGTDAGGSGGVDKVFLRSITALAFSENARARSRRGRGHPQLACVGGSAAGYFWSTDVYPRVVQCANIGWDGASIQWSCNAALRTDLVFGDTVVVCEGYDFPGDQYVLRGSCRLEYTLNYATFRVSALHIVYGSVLTVAMLWVYYYSRIWAGSGIEKFAAHGDATQPLFPAATTYQSTDTPHRPAHLTGPAQR